MTWRIIKAIMLIVINLVVTYGLLGGLLLDWQQSLVFWVIAILSIPIFILENKMPMIAPTVAQPTYSQPSHPMNVTPAVSPSRQAQQAPTGEAVAIQAFLTRRFFVAVPGSAPVPLVIVDSATQLLDYMRYNLSHAPTFSPAQQITSKVLADLQTHIYQARGDCGEQVAVTMNDQPLYLRITSQNRHNLPWAKRRQLPPHTAQLGADENMLPVLITFSDAKERCGAAFGSTGSGKSMLLRAIVMSILEFCPPDDTEVYLIDLDSNQFDDFSVLPQVRSVARTEAQALAVIKYLVDIVNNDRDMSNTIQRYLFIDEFQILSVEADESDQFIDLMEVIAKRGRKHGVPWFVGTQDPTGNNYPRAMQKNTKVTLAGYTQDDSYLVDPLGIVGASKLRGDGDFIFKAAGAQKNFKGFLITPDDIKTFVQAMTNKWGMDRDVIEFEESQALPDPCSVIIDVRPAALPLPTIDKRPRVAKDADKLRRYISEAYDTEAAALRAGWGTRLASILYDKPTKFEGNYRNRVMTAVEYAFANPNEPNERTERTN